MNDVEIFQSMAANLRMTGTQRVWTRMSWASYVMNGFAAVLGGAALPQVIDSFHLSHFWGGIFVAIPAIGITIAGFSTSLLVSRIGVKRLLLIGLASLSFCLFLIGLTRATAYLLIAVFFFGFANGTVEMCGNTVISHIYPQRTAQELNRLHFFYGIGAFLSPLILSLVLRQEEAWQFAYWFVASLLAGLAFLLIFQPEFPGIRKEPFLPGSFLALFRHVGILQIWLGAILLLSSEQGFTGWVTVFLGDTGILPTQLAPLGLAIFWFAMLVGRYLNAILPRSFNRIEIILFESVGSTVALLMVLVSRNLFTSLASIGLVGLLMAGLYSTLLALAGERVPHLVGQISGIYVTGVGTGKLLGPAMVGLVADRVAIPAAMILILLLLVGLILLFLVPTGFQRFQ